MTLHTLERAAKLAVGAIVSLALGALPTREPSLWLDESFTFRATGDSYGHLISQNHWLYYTLVKGWTTVAGHGEARSGPSPS